MHQLGLTLRTEPDPATEAVGDGRAVAPELGVFSFGC